jgi:hypothetical protein
LLNHFPDLRLTRSDWIPCVLSVELSRFYHGLRWGETSSLYEAAQIHFVPRSDTNGADALPETSPGMPCQHANLRKRWQGSQIDEKWVRVHSRIGAVPVSTAFFRKERAILVWP